MELHSESLLTLGFLSRALRPDDERMSILGEVAVGVASRGGGLPRAAELLYVRSAAAPAPQVPVEVEFFRLSLAGRFVLAALNQRVLGYAALARVLGISRADVARLAWQSRLQLAQGEYPSAPRIVDARCPEYDPRAPWTQVVLDEEWESGSEKLFIHTHALECAECREALARARAFFHRVEAKVLASVQAPGPNEPTLRELAGYLYVVDPLKARQLTFREAWSVWAGSRDGKRTLRFALALFAFGLFWRFFLQ